MVHHLYANFLADKKIYNLAQGYWQRLFSGLSYQHRLHFVPYLNLATRIGQREYDGNPIFHALEKKRNRAVRIIQAAPKEKNLEIAAWVDSIALSEKAAPVPELVLDMVLSKESAVLAARLINAWLVAGVSKEALEILIRTELATEIPFEIHITIENLSSTRQQNFLDFCVKNGAKPLLIELSKGDFIHQLMLSKVVYSNNVDKILSISTEMSNAMDRQDFLIKRLKIEIPSTHSDLLKDYSSNFDNYFEWHGKLNYTQPDNLLEVCKKHKVHLSLNSLRNEANTRFITLREFGTKLKFEKRLLSLLNDLQAGGWDVLKQQSEYCIYDNNNFLDHGWLPQ